MALKILHQCKTELDRIAVAGIDFIAGDYRVRNLLPALEKMGTKAAVFKRIASAMKALHDGETPDPAGEFLNLHTLVQAVLVTQADVSPTGQFESLPDNPRGLTSTELGYRTLAPVTEALTTQGSGRLAVLESFFADHTPSDVRLVEPALVAFDDMHIPSHYVEPILAQSGKAVTTRLLATFNPKGKALDARRLILIAQLLKKEAEPLLLDCLLNGSAQVKAAAVEALSQKAVHRFSILEHINASAKVVREAALRAVAPYNDEPICTALFDAFKGKRPEELVEALGINRSSSLLESLINEAQQAMAEAERDVMTALTARRIEALFAIFTLREEKAVEPLLSTWVQRIKSLKSIKSEQSHHYGGREIVTDLCATMAAIRPSRESVEALLPHRELFSGDLIFPTLYLSLTTFEPQEVYTLYSPYLSRLSLGRKEKKLGKQVAKTLDMLLPLPGPFGSLLPDDASHFMFEERYRQALPENITLDPRWVRAAMTVGHLPLVFKTMAPEDTHALRFLKKRLKDASPEDLPYIFAGLIWARDTQAAQLMARVLATKTQRYSYHFERTIRLMRLFSPEQRQRVVGDAHHYPDWIVRLIDELSLEPSMIAGEK